MTSTTSQHSAPIDSISAQRMADSGLRLDLVDTADREAFTRWLRADHRGFHLGHAGEETVDASIAGLAYRRTTGVWDDTARDAPSPVATVNSWIAELTVPGPRPVEAWAISSVTVAPTHRRRGIARALLESELRTAHALGVPLAILTVSESTIYSRFGFAPATFATGLTIDSRRATWTGPDAPGRLHLVPLEEWRAEAAGLHDRIRATGVGQLDGWGLRWDDFAGTVGDDKERAKNLRAVRYDDESGTLRGLALYRVTADDSDFAAHKLSVEYLASETDDAYAALWRYLLEVDLVRTVTAHDRAVDEPLLWQVADMRAVKRTAYDHVWTRLLDVPAALAARSYSADLEISIDVADDLGFAAERYTLRIENGGITVGYTDAAPDLTMTVNELSAIYLGGVSAAVLAASGRISERAPGLAAALDTAFAVPRAPWSSIWF